MDSAVTCTASAAVRGDEQRVVGCTLCGSFWHGSISVGQLGDNCSDLDVIGSRDGQRHGISCTQSSGIGGVHAWAVVVRLTPQLLLHRLGWIQLLLKQKLLGTVLLHFGLLEQHWLASAAEEILHTPRNAHGCRRTVSGEAHTSCYSQRFRNWSTLKL